jgi:hypothetical protein
MKLSPYHEGDDRRVADAIFTCATHGTSSAAPTRPRRRSGFAARSRAPRARSGTCGADRWTRSVPHESERLA